MSSSSSTVSSLEGAVDLQVLRREALQVAQVGVAGAEIIDGDAHADFAQPVQHAHQARGVLHHHALGDLDFHRAGRQLEFAQRFLHHVSAKRSCCSSRGEALMETTRPVWPASIQARACAQAARST